MSEDGQKILSLMPWDIAVRSATQRKAARALVERDDADEIIRGMSPLEVYYALRSLGVDDSTPLLSVIEGEQITALFDLEVWHQERPDYSDLFAWLEGFKEAGFPAFQRAVRTLDVELLSAALRQRLWVTVKPTEDDPEHELPEWLRAASEDIAPIIETPDQQYLIAARATCEQTGEPFEEEDRRTVLRLVEDLYRDEDFGFAARLLHVAAHDLTTELEETALRFRNARMEDLGFPPRERALATYAPLDVERVLDAQEGPRAALELKLPAVLMEPYAHGFFEEVMAGLEDPGLVHEIESELVAVSNAALVADGVEPGNLEGIRPVLERARGYLELALSYRARAEPLEEARRRLREHSVRTLFQVGHSLVVRLATRARPLRSRPALGPKAAFLEDGDLALLRVLTLPRPLYLPEGADIDRVEPFRHPDQLASVERRLAAMEQLAALSEALRFPELHQKATALFMPPAEEWTFEHMLATLIAWHLLGAEGLRVEPLGARELEGLMERLRASDTPEPGPWPALTAAAGGPERMAPLRPRLLAAWSRLSELAQSPVDLRFADPLLRRS